MKKIVLIIILLFVCAGCYDYIELNDLSIIEGIGIDKIDNEYLISLEVLNNEKDGDEKVITKSSIITGNGKTIASAIANAADKTSKTAFLSHLKVVLINYNLEKEDIASLTDYFFRSTEIRNEFYILTTMDYTCNEIFTFDDTKIISDEISSMLYDNKRGKTIASPYYFEEIIENHFNKQQDPALNLITIKNNELAIDGMVLYEVYDAKTIFNAEESKIYNILFENANNIDFIMNDNTISIYSSNISKKIKNNILYLDVELEASFIEYESEKSLKSEDAYSYYNDIYSKEINSKIQNLYEKILDANTDILGIEDLYYIEYKKKIDWRKIDYKITTNLKINKEGLIFNL